MQRIRYKEFKAEAIKQITERGYGVVEVPKRCGFQIKDFIPGIEKIKPPYNRTPKTCWQSSNN